MNIRNFKEQILKLRNSFEVSDQKANALWTKYKDCDEEKFLGICCSMAYSGTLFELETALEKAFGPKVETEDSPREELGYKPLPPIETPKVAPPVESYCCSKGLIWKRDALGANFIFRCSCQWGNYVGTKYPIWTDNLKEIYRDP